MKLHLIFVILLLFNINKPVHAVKVAAEISHAASLATDDFSSKKEKQTSGLRKRFQRWKTKISIKILKKFALNQRPDSKDMPFGRTGLILGLSALGILLAAYIIIGFGVLLQFAPILISGILIAVIAEILGIIAFFKGLNGIKYDKNPKRAIASLIIGSLFVIGLLIFLMFIPAIDWY